MIAEAIQKILDIRSVATFEIDGVTYSTEKLHEVWPQRDPFPTAMNVASLNGFATLIKQQIENFDPQEFVIHIEDHLTVKLVSLHSEVENLAQAWRPLLVIAKPVQTMPFAFGQYHDQESFIIGVASKFADGGDKKYVIDIASSITQGATRKAEDDGLSQKVTTQRGLTLRDQVVVRNRVSLAPFRTFPEVVQPTSEFLFRLQECKEEQVPKLALFEADGGAWKLQAMKNIKAYLEGLQLGLEIVA